jgi:hypothetical protein
MYGLALSFAVELGPASRRFLLDISGSDVFDFVLICIGNTGRQKRQPDNSSGGSAFGMSMSGSDVLFGGSIC